MRTIPLTRGYETLVDDADFEALSAFRWKANVTISGRVYATRRVKLPDGRWSHQSMHRLLMGEPHGMDVDHLNGDTLDNRRANLRACSRSQNLRNSTGAVGKGAYLCKATRRWNARVSIDGKRICLGRFQSLQEAEMAIARVRLAEHDRHKNRNSGDGQQAVENDRDSR